VKKLLYQLRERYRVNFCIANGENSAGGRGITFAMMQELYNSGVDAITMGNHTWSKKEIMNFIDQEHCIIRPANFPSQTPGKGSTILDGRIGIINLLGRVYMNNTSLDCPFMVADREVSIMKKDVNAILVDMHAEASSEKAAMGWYLDGRVSCVLGTHTHVQTADEKILENGTGFITDVGMTGPSKSVIGTDKDIAIKKFITGIPVMFEVATGQSAQLNAVLVQVDESSGKTTNITRICELVQLGS